MTPPPKNRRQKYLAVHDPSSDRQRLIPQFTVWALDHPSDGHPFHKGKLDLQPLAMPIEMTPVISQKWFCTFLKEDRPERAILPTQLDAREMVFWDLGNT